MSNGKLAEERDEAEQDHSGVVCATCWKNWVPSKLVHAFAAGAKLNCSSCQEAIIDRMTVVALLLRKQLVDERKNHRCLRCGDVFTPTGDDIESRLDQKCATLFRARVLKVSHASSSASRMEANYGAQLRR